MIEKARATFNLARAEELSGIRAEGKKLAAAVALLNAENEKNRAQAEEKENVAEQYRREIASLEADINAPVKAPASVLAAQQVLSERKAKIEEEISGIQNNRAGALVQLQSGLADVLRELRAYDDIAARVEANKKAEIRVQELNTEHKILAADLERAEKEIDLCEMFTRTQAQLLTGSIENHFSYAKFRLFENQVNGGLIPCCEVCTPNGVPYGMDASQSERAIAGLDIIKTLSKHWGISLPIFIDSRESITKIPDMEAQAISLIVSPEDETLRVETKG